nr:unnamed protein product [Callosobruchus chinensis]
MNDLLTFSSQNTLTYLGAVMISNPPIAGLDNTLGTELADAASPDEGILTPVTDWLNNIKKTI